jgi:D-alanyl-D-alanine carboxypeptidase
LFNSHGNDAYDQLKNISTCNEIAKIASEFMGYPLLREIVRTPKYGHYQNTNKLLEDGFEGIKTGITETAGPCLAAAYKDYIIVVLSSKSMNERWI